LHSNKRVNLHFSPNNIIVVVKSRKRTQTGKCSKNEMDERYVKKKKGAKPEPKLSLGQIISTIWYIQSQHNTCEKFYTNRL